MRRVTFLLVMVALLAANAVIGAVSPSFGQEVAVCSGLRWAPPTGSEIMTSITLC